MYTFLTYIVFFLVYDVVATMAPISPLKRTPTLANPVQSGVCSLLGQFKYKKSPEEHPISSVGVQPQPVLIVLSHGGMARLSWRGWLAKIRANCLLLPADRGG